MLQSVGSQRVGHTERLKNDNKSVSCTRDSRAGETRGVGEAMIPLRDAS